MRVVFPWQPLRCLRVAYYWRRWGALWRAVVRIDPWEMSPAAIVRVANRLAVAHTPFETSPSFSEQDRRRQTPVFKLYTLLLAEQDRYRFAERKLLEYREALIAARQENTRLTRGLAGANGGLQNPSLKGSTPSLVSPLAVLTWRGKPVANLSREELEDAFQRVCGVLRAKSDDVELLASMVRNLQKYGP